MAVAMRGASVGLVLAVGLGSGGCAAAGLAAGPLVSAVRAIGDRAVERTVPADVRATAAAVEAVLLRSGVRVEERSAERHGLRLRGTSETITVHATLEPVTTRMTRLSLRIETGGLVADRTTGEHLHDQVALALQRVPAAGASSDDRAHLAALAALEAEVQRLRAAIDAERSSRREPVARTEEAVARPMAPAFSVNRNGVVAIPTSYGLPTVARPASSSTLVTPPAAGRASSTPRPAADPDVPVATEAPAQASETAPALRPVGALTPTGAIAGARHAR